jgi:uncharacterized protein involved in exopolysaccharide biosynthesis
MEVSQTQEEIISTKDLIIKILNIFKLISSNWRLILIAAGLGSATSLLFDVKSFKKPIYQASITFNLENGSAGGANDMANFASAFGMGGMGGMGGAKSVDLFSGENFWEILKTRIVIEKALMTEVNLNGKKILMVNFYIEKSGIIDNEWAGTMFKKPADKFIKYRFQKKNPINFSKFENEIMTDLVTKIQAEAESGQINTSSLNYINTFTENEMLSKVWIETLLTTVYEFYKELKTKKTQMMLNIAERRADSLKIALYGNEQNLASYINQNNSMIMAEGQMQQQRMTRNTGILVNFQAQTLLQIDQLKTVLINQTPLYTIIEPVRLPLKAIKMGYGSNLTLGAIVGMILMTVFLIIKKAYESIVEQL